MNERQKRLKEVYEHLRKFYGIHTQSDFANALRKSRNAITLALNGDEKYLTDKLFTTICEAYRGVFNLDYLLTGKETLLAKTEDQRQPVQATEPMPMWADNLIDIIAKQIKKTKPSTESFANPSPSSMLPVQTLKKSSIA